MTNEETPEPELEIGTLLAAAFEKEPAADLGDRVVRRVAFSATVAELAQMFIGAPVHWARRDLAPDDASDDEPDGAPADDGSDRARADDESGGEPK